MTLAMILIILSIIAIITFILLIKRQLTFNEMEDTFPQIHDNLIKKASDSYNNVYNKIVPNATPINCNKNL